MLIAAPRASSTFFWASAAVTSAVALTVAAVAAVASALESVVAAAPLSSSVAFWQRAERGLRVGHSLVGVYLRVGGVLGRTLGGGRRHREGVGAIELAERLGQLDYAIGLRLGGLVVRLLRLGGGLFSLPMAGLFCLPCVCAVDLASA